MANEDHVTEQKGTHNVVQVNFPRY